MMTILNLKLKEKHIKSFIAFILVQVFFASNCVYGAVIFEKSALSPKLFLQALMVLRAMT